MTTALTAAAELSIISPVTLREARASAQASRRPYLEVLEEVIGDPPQYFAARLALTLSYPCLGMESLRSIAPDFGKLSYAECLRRQCLVAKESEQWIAVVADPFDLQLRAWLEERLGATRWYIASRQDIAALLALHEETLQAFDDAVHAGTLSAATPSSVTEVSLASIADDASPTIRLVNSTIYDAIKLSASDIHLECLTDGLRIKYRVDGVLTTAATIRGFEAAEQAISRIKIMAELDIAEKRIPQDGRFKLSVKGRETDFRISVMPSLHGEDVVIRILDKRALTDQFQSLRLDLLGFDAASLFTIRQMANEPYGMLLVTGPTGSGKTTTLYAALSEINNGRDKIITIEDPVEYQLPGILQIPVNERKGLTFARGLRSILRHDPDKILIGEIRDPETAHIAIQSALTGHLVFTSVHANNVFDVLGRFLHMGVDANSFASALNGILAQRLVRLNCPSCIAETSYPEEDLRASNISVEEAAGMTLRRGRGCGQCRGTGYRGRGAISEILRFNDELRELVVSRAPISVLKQTAKANGTRFLRQSALQLLGQGKTSLEEINRVTFID